MTAPVTPACDTGHARPCGCTCDFYVFGHTCEHYGAPRLAEAVRRLREQIERITAITTTGEIT